MFWARFDWNHVLPEKHFERLHPFEPRSQRIRAYAKTSSKLAAVEVIKEVIRGVFFTPLVV